MSTPNITETQSNAIHNLQEEITLTAEEAASLRQGYQFCPRCRSEMVDRMAYGRLRRVCADASCRFVQFIDPKVGAAMLAVSHDNRVLLVKRNVEPARGSWCLPGGFMEIGETPQATAIRECQEESGCIVEITGLIDVYYYENYRGSGVLIVYKGRVVDGIAQPGDDADDVAFFGPDELPENIVFQSNVEALALWRAGKI
jgi:ADP-ribose pyrophosphatase YjhB (NUDIX family)